MNREKKKKKKKGSKEVSMVVVECDVRKGRSFVSSKLAQRKQRGKRCRVKEDMNKSEKSEESGISGGS